MDTTFATKLLDVFIENALRILEAGFGVNKAESSFFDVIQLLRQEASLKKNFLERLRKTFSVRAPEQLEPGTIPVELVELVAHELRWPELLKLAQERIDKVYGGDAALAVG